MNLTSIRLAQICVRPRITASWQREVQCSPERSPMGMLLLLRAPADLTQQGARAPSYIRHFVAGVLERHDAFDMVEI